MARSFWCVRCDATKALASSVRTLSTHTQQKASAKLANIATLERAQKRDFLGKNIPTFDYHSTNNFAPFNHARRKRSRKTKYISPPDLALSQISARHAKSKTRTRPQITGALPMRLHRQSTGFYTLFPRRKGAELTPLCDRFEPYISLICTALFFATQHLRASRSFARAPRLVVFPRLLRARVRTFGYTSSPRSARLGGARASPALIRASLRSALFQFSPPN